MPINGTTPPTTGSSLGPAAWVGVSVAIGTLLLIMVGVLIGVCVVYRCRASIRGFYETHESNGAEASMLRYSASLRQLSSEIVSLNSSKDGTSWGHKNGSSGGDYSNGGPPTMTSLPMNRTPVGGKEYYL